MSKPYELPSFPGSNRTPEHWEARYVQGTTPWETGRVDRNLDRNLDRLVATWPVAPGRALEIGCGTGSDSIWLAKKGFDVTARDVAETAIQRARARADELGVEVDFAVGSIPDDEAAFSFAYDCGCFHTLERPEDRESFAAALARTLQADGLWLSIMGSTDGPPRDHGPPRVSAHDITSAVEPHFEILSLTSDMYDAKVPTPARAWVLLSRKRTRYT